MTEKNNIMPKTELAFSINEIIPLMATEYAKEAAASILKSTISSTKGLFKKYKIDTEQVDDTYFALLSQTIISRLEETFETELKTRFTDEDSITLLFFNNTLRLGIDNINVSTDDFRVLFHVLFLEKLNTSINLNNLICVNFENMTFLERLASGIIEQIDMYEIFQYVPTEDGRYKTATIFCFNKEDLQVPDNLVKKFKFLKKIRKH